MHAQDTCALVYNYVIVCMSARKKAPVRGHIQTILEKINVIMTLGGEGV